MAGTGPALGEACPSAVPGGNPLKNGVAIHMKHEQQIESDEPVGIVISRGKEPVTTPRFSAYVWAPGPDDELETGAIAA